MRAAVRKAGPRRRRRAARAVLGIAAVLALGLVMAWVTMCPPEAAPVRAAVPPPTGGGPTLRVMTFNVLNGRSDRHVAAWEKRKEWVARHIQDFGPDLVGTQEVLGFQAEYLQSRLPGYGFVGVGRDDGKEKGEREGIFYRQDRFDKVQEGHFWLSETPDVAGSKGPRCLVPRMVSWVELRPRDDPRRTLFFFNAHFDAVSIRARNQSAALLRRRIEAIAGGRPAIVVGDFNTHAGSATYQALLADPGAGGLRLIDSYRAVYPRPAGNEGTYHLPAGVRVNRRLDWVLYTPHFRALDARIDTSKSGGRYPSDHFPVAAVLHLETGREEGAAPAGHGAMALPRQRPRQDPSSPCGSSG